MSHHHWCTFSTSVNNVRNRTAEFKWSHMTRPDVVSTAKRATAWPGPASGQQPGPGSSPEGTQAGSERAWDRQEDTGSERTWDRQEGTGSERQGTVWDRRLQIRLGSNP